MRRLLLVLLLSCTAARATAQGIGGAPHVLAPLPDTVLAPLPDTVLAPLPDTVLAPLPDTVRAPGDAARGGARGIVTRRELLAAGTVALAAAATMPFDVRVAEAVRAPGPQGSAFLHRGAAVANTAGDPGTVLASVALYGVGRALGQPRVAALGVHAAAAVVIAGTGTALLKVLAGRQRPYVEAMDASDFAPAHGFHGGRTSLPSGHTAAAFAFASAVSGDLREWRPGVARVASPLLYAGATTVGLARMYDNRHWASDVILAAGIGTLTGRAVSSYAHLHPHNWLDRHLGAVSMAPAADGRGLAIVVHGTIR